MPRRLLPPQVRTLVAALLSSFEVSLDPAMGSAAQVEAQHTVVAAKLDGCGCGCGPGAERGGQRGLSERMIQTQPLSENVGFAWGNALVGMEGIDASHGERGCSPHALMKSGPC